MCVRCDDHNQDVYDSYDAYLVNSDLLQVTDLYYMPITVLCHDVTAEGYKHQHLVKLLEPLRKCDVVG